MKLGLPGQVRDLDRGLADGDTGPRARQQLAAREHRGNDQWNSRRQNLETQHDTLARRKPVIRRAYGWQSVNKTRYRQVDVRLAPQGGREPTVRAARPRTSRRR